MADLMTGTSVNTIQYDVQCTVLNEIVKYFGSVKNVSYKETECLGTNSGRVSPLREVKGGKVFSPHSICFFCPMWRK